MLVGPGVRALLEQAPVLVETAAREARLQQTQALAVGVVEI
jgi:hypothetical protein